MQWAIGDLEADTTPSKEIDRDELGRNALRTLMSATKDDELAEALNTLSWCPRPDALPKAVEMLGRDQAVAAAAAGAVQAIVAIADGVPREKKIDILKRALPCATSRSVRRDIRKLLRGLGVTDIPVNVPPGFIAHWWVAGPLPNPRPHESFDKAFPPEARVDLAEGFAAAGKTFAWKQVETDDDGILDLNAALGRASNVLAYMYAEVTVEKETAVELRLGSDDGFVLWLNGKRLGGKNVNRGLRPNADRFKTTLAAGANKILVKVTQGGGFWSGCLQIVGPKGGKTDFKTRTK